VPRGWGPGLATGSPTEPGAGSLRRGCSVRSAGRE
jgi:hypothetical protein